MRRSIALVISAALVAVACSGSGESAFSELETDESTEAATPDIATTEDAAIDAGSDDDERIAVADEWIRTSSELSPEVLESLEVVGVERVGQASHVRYVQKYEGVPVDGAGLVVHLLSTGEVQGVSSSLTDAQPMGDAMVVTAETATEVAEKAVEGTVTSADATEIWIDAGGTLAPGWRIEIGTVDPLGSWSVVVDGVASTVVRVERDQLGRQRAQAGLASRVTGRAAKIAVQAGGDRCDLPAAPSACVFRPDPIFAAGGALDDPGAANDHLTGVSLEGLLDPGSGVLVGEFADLDPDGAPVAFDPEPDGVWGAGRGERGFEAQNTYYWIDYGQRTVQRLGFPELLNRPFPVVSVDPSTVDNAFYSAAEQRVYMGIGSNGINEGEDASGILHEYGHALLDAVNNDLLVGGDVGAYHEGFGDIFAFFTSMEFRTGDAPCFFAWTDDVCLRRMDEEKVYPDDVVFAVHDDGEIISGAVYAFFVALLDQEGRTPEDCEGTTDCNLIRDRVLTTALAANYYLTPRMTMPDIAGAYLAANEAQFGAADQELMEQVFAGRGLADGNAMIDPGGGGALVTPTVDGVGVEIDIAHTYRGDLSVTVGVVDADFGELCPPVVLFEPDADDGEDGFSGFFDLADDPCAAFLPPGPDQRWVLLVEDTLADDEGTILSFDVFDGENRHPAAGLPVPIADADPAGSIAVVDASGVAPDMDGAEVIGDGGGVIDALIQLDHPYRGDLTVRAGVADADDAIICTVPILEADPTDSTPGIIEGAVDMTACAELWPPAPERQWYLQVIDSGVADVGSVGRFTVTGEGETFDFGDVPVEIPDANVDGVALVLDGSTGSTSQVGGSGQGADVGLPAVELSITHPYIGDLSVLGEVLDASGNVVCETVLVTPDSLDSSADLAGQASMADCADFYPPAPDRQWVLVAADTLVGDTGSIDSAVLIGADGVRHPFTGTPAPLPDADPTGVVLAAGPSDTAMGGEPEVVVVISHPYVGDLDVVAGVLDSSGNVLCSSQLLLPNSEDNTVDAVIVRQLPECAAFLPPSPSQQWVVLAVDTAAFDEGTIDGFTVFAPDGSAWEAGPTVPVVIPDDNADGAVALVDGSVPLS